MSICRVTQLVLALSVAGLCTATRADIINLYTENLDAFDVTQDLGDGTFYGVQTVPEGSSPFSDGNAIRVFDFSPDDKPELQGELSAPLLEPFRIDFQSFDRSTVASSSAIRFRMGNTGQSITSESRSAFSLSWQSDGEFTAKYNGAADGSSTDVDTTSSDQLVGVQDITMIANGAVSGSYTYDIFGITRTLNPLSYDVYINGVLLNDSMPGDTNHDDFKNGLLFHDRPTDDYDPTLGLQRFGLIGSSDANVNPDYMFDNIILRTGGDIGNVIPEPSSWIGMLCGAGLLLWSRRSLGSTRVVLTRNA